MNYFKTEEKSIREYRPVFTDVLWNELGKGLMSSSWLVLYARVWGLSYPDFLRYIRQEYNATLCGRKSTYIHFYFADKKDCDLFVLNTNKKFENWKNERN